MVIQVLEGCGHYPCSIKLLPWPSSHSIVFRTVALLPPPQNTWYVPLPFTTHTHTGFFLFFSFSPSPLQYFVVSFFWFFFLFVCLTRDGCCRVHSFDFMGFLDSSDIAPARRFLVSRAYHVAGLVHLQAHDMSFSSGRRRTLDFILIFLTRFRSMPKKISLARYAQNQEPSLVFFLVIYFCCCWYSL